MLRVYTNFLTRIIPLVFVPRVQVLIAPPKDPKDKIVNVYYILFPPGDQIIRGHSPFVGKSNPEGVYEGILKLIVVLRCGYLGGH